MNKETNEVTQLHTPVCEMSEPDVDVMMCYIYERRAVQTMTMVLLKVAGAVLRNRFSH